MLLGVIISLFSFQINAQSVETGVLPSITSAEGQFTEWKKVEFTASYHNKHQGRGIIHPGQHTIYFYRIYINWRKVKRDN